MTERSFFPRLAATLALGLAAIATAPATSAQTSVRNTDGVQLPYRSVSSTDDASTMSISTWSDST